MESLTKNQILGRNDLEVLEVPVPEWGGSIFVKKMTGKQLDEYWSFLDQKPRHPPNLEMSKLLAMVACDAEGIPLFEAGDEQHISTKSASVIRRVFDEIKDFVGETPATAKKNTSDPVSDSGSDSPELSEVALSANSRGE